MKEFDYNQLFIEFLPTDERREFESKLRDYAEHFQAQIESIEDVKWIDKIIDKFNKEKRIKKYQELQSRLMNYMDLVEELVIRSQDAFSDKFFKRVEPTQNEVERFYKRSLAPYLTKY